jgi:hypothetical protein
MNDSVKARFGDLLISICEAEIVIAQKDAEIEFLKAELLTVRGRSEDLGTGVEGKTQ